MFTGLGSFCYAELGTLIKKSGGDYAYIMEAFGPFLAFVRLWIEAIVVRLVNSICLSYSTSINSFVYRPCTCTIVAITFAVYILRPFYPDCSPPPGSVQLIAAALLSECVWRLVIDLEIVKIFQYSSPPSTASV